MIAHLQLLAIPAGILLLGLGFKLQQLGILAGEQRRIRKAAKAPRVGVDELLAVFADQRAVVHDLRTPEQRAADQAAFDLALPRGAA